MSEELRLCPKLLVREERKAIAIGTGDIIVSYFQPCLKEKCMAYSGRHCDEYPVSGSTYYEPQEDNGFFDEIMDDESDGETYEKIKEIIDKAKEQEE